MNYTNQNKWWKGQTPDLLTYPGKLKKLLFILIFLTVGALQAAQNGELFNLSKGSFTVAEVLNKIESESAYRFVYKINDVRLDRVVNLPDGKLSLSDLLQRIFSTSTTSFTLEGEQVILSKKDTVGQSQQVLTISGTVTDEEGVPLPGVTVTIEGTSRGTFTDLDGNYSIQASRGQKIQFDYVGLTTEIYTVGEDIPEIIELKADVESLGEVVVTGYQVLRKEQSVGATVKPDLEVVENRSTSMNVLERLDGLIPGLVINNQPNSEVGTDNSILIRGLNSINANRQPLFVVDGVPLADVSRINPQDVADINILKDATATAIYGARATNGVIVITTKRGTKDSRIRIDYDNFVSFRGKPDYDYYPTLNSREFINLTRELFDPVINPYGQAITYSNIASTAVGPHEQILYDLDNGVITAAQAEAQLNELAAFDNKKQIGDLWYRNAILTNHTLSFSGGGEKHTFYTSAAYTDNQSFRPGEEDHTIKLNANQTFTFTKRIKFNLITDLTQRLTRGKNPITIDTRAYPFMRFQDTEGNPLNTNYMQGFSRDPLMGFEEASGLDLQYNPLLEFERERRKGEDFQARLVLGAEIEVLKGIRYQGLYSYVHGNASNERFLDENHYDVRLELAQFTVPGENPGEATYFLPEVGGHLINTFSQSRDWIIRNQFTYDLVWKDGNHQLSLLAGQEAQERRMKFQQTYARGYNDQLLTSTEIDYNTLTTSGVQGVVIPNNNGGRSILTRATIPNRFSETLNRFTSYYGNATYTLMNRYVVNGSVRIDESNLFGRDKSAQNRPVWSVGGKWILSNEGFMSNAKDFNLLALRMTYGITGNAPNPGTASSFDILSPTSSGFLPNGVGLNISSPSNTKLTWERTRNFNLGMDLNMWNNRMNLTLDYYNKRTDNLIGLLPTNPLTGFANIIGNFGDMENNGIEIGLQTVNIQTSNFQWYSRLNLAYNENKITRLNTDIPIVTALELLGRRYVEGQAAFALHAYDFAGLDELGDPQIRLADGTITKERGSALAEDALFQGSYVPKVNGGMSQGFRYKGLGLDANFVYSFGAVMRDDVIAFNDFAGRNLTIDRPGDFTTGNIHRDFLDRWQQPGDEEITNIPSYVSTTAENSSRRDIDYYRRGNIHYLSADYVKLRDVTLSYSLPKEVISNFGADRISFRLQLSNVLLWKANNRGIDPEFHDPYTGTRGLPVNQNSITAGIHVTF